MLQERLQRPPEFEHEYIHEKARQIPKQFGHRKNDGKKPCAAIL